LRFVCLLYDRRINGRILIGKRKDNPENQSESKNTDDSNSDKQLSA